MEIKIKSDGSTEYKLRQNESKPLQKARDLCAAFADYLPVDTKTCATGAAQQLTNLLVSLGVESRDESTEGDGDSSTKGADNGSGSEAATPQRGKAAPASRGRSS